MKETAQIADIRRLSPPREVFCGFWMRLLAVMIDGLVLYIPQNLFVFAVNSLAIATLRQQENYDAIPMVIKLNSLLIGTVIGFVYFGILQAKLGYTVGKLALGIRVVNADGTGVSDVGQCLERYAMFILGLAFLCLGPVSCAWDDNKRAWHDKMAETFVVHKAKLDAFVSQQKQSSAGDESQKNAA